MTREEILALASAMTQAGSAALEALREGMEVKDKTSPQDVVTEADLKSERILAVALRQMFPSDGIMSEEGEFFTGGRTWFLDPIDGTANYAGGSDYWGLSAGTVRGFGMIYLPVDGAGSWFWVEDDGKAGMSYECDLSATFDLRVESPSPCRLRDALVDVGAWPGLESVFVDVRQKARMTGMINSFVWEAMLVAQGKLDAYVHAGATIFDVAAAIPICRAAGCVVTGVAADEPVPDLADPEIGQRKFPIVIACSRQLSDELRTLVAPLIR